MDCDIVIIGGGPAGLMAAKTAIEEGMKVILIEKKKNAADYVKPCCSMLLLEPGYHNEFVTVEDGKICFRNTGFCVNYSGEYVDLAGSIRLSPSGYPFKIYAENGIAAKTIDKDTLLRGILKEIESKADIRQSATGIIAEEVREGVKVKIKDKSGEKDLTGKFAFVADGVNSSIVNRMGLNKERKLYAKGMALSYLMEGINFPYKDSFLTFIGKGYTAAGQFYMVPKKMEKFGRDNKVWEVTFGIPTGMNINPKEQLTKFIKEGPVKEWFTDAKVMEEIGCAMSFYSPIPHPADGNVVVLGDAASFQEVENQGALMCGHMASKIAADCLAGKEKNLEKYNDFWQRSFEFNKPGVVETTAKIYAIHTFADEQIDYLFSLENDFTVPGYINHNTCANVMFGGFSRHYDRIKQERPEIAVAIDKFNNAAVDSLLQT